jgi:hypothetical protein
MGCGSLVADTIWANYIAKAGYNFILRPQETPGYMYNIREMANNKARWPNTLFETEDTIPVLGYTAGGTPIMKDFLPKKIDIPWKLLYNVGWWSQGMWFITFDENIKKIGDLKGKKVGLGLKTQSDWGMDATLYLDVAYGITEKNASLFYLGPDKMTDALLDGKVAAICMGMGTNGTKKDGVIKDWIPSGVYLKLKASGRRLYYIPMDGWAVDKIDEKFGTSYYLLTVPAGTLKDQQADLTVGADRAYAASHKSFPEDLAYQVVMSMAKLGPEMQKSKAHGFWVYAWKYENMVSGLSEKNAHPGAIRAYKELGLWDKRNEFPIVKWPMSE